MSHKEGTLWATTVMLQTLLGKLVAKRILTPEDVIDLVGDAEEYLAGLDPSSMSPGARDHAKTILQAMGKISPDY